MKIAITGASGFVGQELVHLLAFSGAQLLLIGRDRAKLASIFPGHEICAYDEIGKLVEGFDQVIHLAVINSDSSMSESEMHRVNVDLLIEVAEKARDAGVRRFVNVSSIHALDWNDASPYAKSKRAAVRELAALERLETVTVYLPLVYGQRWAGKLKFLKKLPLRAARLIFSILAAARPTVDIALLRDFVLLNSNPVCCENIILSDGQARNVSFAIFKRAIDLAFAVGILALFWWALILIWAFARWDFPGSGLFSQRRIGLGGKEFICYKFRTMKSGVAHAGTHEVSASAVTPFGRFLRNYKLDEIPQVWNILRNEMSLIGPRPCMPVQVELIAERRQRGVLAIKPGISGLAQINNIDMSDPQLLARWDARYMRLQSLLLDVEIAIATAFGSGRGDRVGR